MNRLAESWRRHSPAARWSLGLGIFHAVVIVALVAYEAVPGIRLVANSELGMGVGYTLARRGYERLAAGALITTLSADIYGSITQNYMGHVTPSDVTVNEGLLVFSLTVVWLAGRLLGSGWVLAVALPSGAVGMALYLMAMSAGPAPGTNTLGYAIYFAGSAVMYGGFRLAERQAGLGPIVIIQGRVRRWRQFAGGVRFSLILPDGSIERCAIEGDSVTIRRGVEIVLVEYYRQADGGLRVLDFEIVSDFTI